MIKGKRRYKIVSFRKLCKDITHPNYYTNDIHRYPGRIIPHIPHYVLAKRRLCPKNGTVLDPFCGSGTVLLEAKLNGFNAIGIDINPFAALISKVKTTKIRETIIKNYLENILCGNRSTYYSIPKIGNINLWFGNTKISFILP